MSFRQVWLARVNCVERSSMPEAAIEKLTLPPEKTGSGKSVIPCERMQATALR